MKSKFSFPVKISGQYSGQWILKRNFLDVQGWLETSGCRNEKSISGEHHFSDLCLNISKKGTGKPGKIRSLPQSNIALSGIRMWFLLSVYPSSLILLKGKMHRVKGTLHFFPEQFKTLSFFFLLCQNRYLTKSLSTIISSFTSCSFTIFFKALFGTLVSLLLYFKDGKIQKYDQRIGLGQE